jgi:hypothetical protein
MLKLPLLVGTRNFCWQSPLWHTITSYLFIISSHPQDNAALSRREGIAVTIVTREHSAVGSNGQVRAAVCGATWTGETKAQRRIRDAFRRRERCGSRAAVSRRVHPACYTEISCKQLNM